MTQKDVSSAEITAIYRSAIPALSRDTLSEKLASDAGQERAAARSKPIFSIAMFNRRKVKK